MVRIKICGLTSLEQAAVAAEAGADFVGLVFAEQSRRHVSVHQAKIVIAGLPVPASPGEKLVSGQGSDRPVRWFESSAAFLDERLRRKRPLVVGVFADMPASMINAIADRVGLDLVQLSGHEPWEEALAIRRPVIKAVRVGAKTSAAVILEEIEVGTADLCLLDTDLNGALGGTGEVFDWSVAAGVAAELPVMLAGGLSAENVASAVRSVRPWAVDVSSGVETDGAKDLDKIRLFIHRVRKLESESQV